MRYTHISRNEIGDYAAVVTVYRSFGRMYELSLDNFAFCRRK